MTAVSAKTSLCKSQIAHGWIRERTTSGKYPPGSRLVLGQIADEISVRVVPVREAIRLLEAEGMVAFERNVGAQVAMIDANEYCHALQALGIIEAATRAHRNATLDAFLAWRRQHGVEITDPGEVAIHL